MRNNNFIERDDTMRDEDDNEARDNSIIERSDVVKILNEIFLAGAMTFGRIQKKKSISQA